MGFWIGRLRPGWTQPLAIPLVRFGVPVSVMGLLLKGGLNWSLAAIALTAALAISTWMLVLQGLPPAWRPVSSPALQIGCALGNTAYFGIPVALALLPSEALPISIGYDLGATLLAWSLGPFWLRRKAPAGSSAPSSADDLSTGRQGTVSELLRQITASPASRGLVGALLVQSTPWGEAIASALWLPSRIVIVLALVVVGMRLGAIPDDGDTSASHLDTRSELDQQRGGELRAALICKLLLFPSWVWLLCSLLPLSILSRQALVLQGAAPAAISVLLMAEHAGTDADRAARLILRSTLLALISVPLWWYLLLQPSGTL